MRAVKWTILIILIIILLLIGAVGLVVATLDPNDYKEEISTQVKEQTGRDLALTGDISWSLFPWLGLNLGELSLSNAKGFGDKPFASLEEVDIHVALMPLLQKKVHAKEITVRGLNLNLQKNKDGKDNWSDLAQSSNDADKKVEEQKPAEPSKSGDLTIDIEGINIENATLSYNDQQAGQDILLSPFNLSSGALKFGTPVSFVSDLQLQQNGLQIGLDLAGKLMANPETGQFKLSDFVIRQEFSGDQIPGGKQSGVARMGISADTNTQVIEIDELSVDILGMSLQGKLQVAQFIDAPRYSGNLSSNTFNLRQLLEKLGQAAPSTQKADALGSTSIAIDFKGDTKQAALKPLIIKIDQSRLEGEVSLKDFATQAIDFNLVIDRLNLDHYLPKSAPSEAAPKTSGEPAPATTQGDKIELPTDLLKSLNVNGSARIEELTVKELLFTQASVTVKTNKGLVQISPLSAQAYNGSAKINASLDVRKATPKYKADVDMTGVHSGDILETLFGDRYLSGVANFSANAHTSGESVSSLTQALNGSFKTKFSDGTIKGSKLSAKILEARNFVRKLEGKDALENKVTDDTKFSILTATGSIKNGVVTNPDLSLVAPLFHARGEGSVDLPKEFIDYTLKLGRPPSEGKETYSIPLNIKGPFSNLKFKLAADDAAKQYAKDELKKQKAALKKKADAEKARLRKKAEEEKAKLKAKVEKEKAELQEKANEKLKEKQNELENKLKDEVGKKLENLFK